MRKQNVLLVLAFVVCLIAVVLFIPASNQEPVYRGWKISSLLPYYVTSDYSHKALANEAFRELGTNVLPILVEWLKYEPSFLRTKADGLIRSMLDSDFYDKRVQRAGFASIALGQMGTMAAPVLPELIKLRDDPKSSQPVSSRAGDAIVFIQRALAASQTNAAPRSN